MIISCQQKQDYETYVSDVEILNHDQWSDKTKLIFIQEKDIWEKDSVFNKSYFTYLDP